MLVKRAEMFPVECVARGYLAGSGWKEYEEQCDSVRHSTAGGLLDGSRLPEPIFTPATKSQDGAHDENISFAATEKLLGTDRRRGIAPADAGTSTRGPRSMRNRAD